MRLLILRLLGCDDISGATIHNLAIIHALHFSPTSVQLKGETISAVLLPPSAFLATLGTLACRVGSRLLAERSHLRAARRRLPSPSLEVTEIRERDVHRTARLVVTQQVGAAIEVEIAPWS